MFQNIGTEKHACNLQAVSKSGSMMQFVSCKKTSSDDYAVTNAEVLFTGFIVEHNLPISVSDHASSLFPRMFPDSKIAQKYGSRTTKTTHIINGAVAPSSIDSFVSHITAHDGPKYFGIATDGSNDEEDKFYPLLIRHWSTENVVVSSFLDMPVSNKGDAKSIFETLDSALIAKGLSWENCITYSSDNASVMVGKHNSVLSRIREKSPSVYDVGCACHLAHLCASNAAKAITGFDTTEFLLDLYYHFDKSCKRKSELREFIVFCDLGVRKVLKHVVTRWLSQSKCIDRALQLWDGLKSYILSKFDNDSSVEQPRKRRKSGTQSKQIGNREQRLVQAFKHPMTKAYIMFLQSALPAFSEFTLILEKNEPMIHSVHPAMMRMYKDILQKLVCVEVIAENQDRGSILDVDFDDVTTQRNDRNLFIGFMTKQYIMQNDEISYSSLQKFYQCVREFYCRALRYMQEKFPLRNDTLMDVTFLDPRQRLKSEFIQLERLSSRFPLLGAEISMDELFSEFTDYQLCADIPEVGDCRIDAIWHDIGQICKDDGKLRFPNLFRFARYLLIIPHSNAYCETLFNIVRKLAVDVRSQLGKNTKQGCSGTSVYSDITGTRNTLCGLLAAKLNVFKNSNKACFEWKPSEELLQKAKSATCKTLNARDNEKNV